MLNQEYLRLLDDSKVKKLEEEISAKDNDYLSNYSRTANIHRNFTGFYDVEPIENLNSDRQNHEEMMDRVIGEESFANDSSDDEDDHEME